MLFDQQGGILTTMKQQLTATVVDPDLLFLPWEIPLEQWDEQTVAPIARGISRHIVRFVKVNNAIYAVKETVDEFALREYAMLTSLQELDVPCVEQAGVVQGRTDKDGNALGAALLTKHLTFSLPYRALFSTTLRPQVAERFLDALALLLVRLHLNGFLWGDCSLSNTLFRRDAGSFAAYLVDAETGELHAKLTDGQRTHDIENARINIAGELLDLEAGELLHPSMDPIETANSIISKYQSLWQEVTEPVEVTPGERFKLYNRITKLNELGFDVAEMKAESSDGQVYMRPVVLEPNFYAQKLAALTGLNVEEQQGRELMKDLEDFRSKHNITVENTNIAAHRWVSERFNQVIAKVPPQMRAKFTPAQLYYEILQYRWKISEESGQDIGIRSAADDYIEKILGSKPDERAIIGTNEPDDLTEIENTAALRIIAD